MNLLKIITLLNWLIIAFLGILILMEALSPSKGGDAAGRGMGQAIYILAICTFVVLLVLNILPYQWAKYTAFGLVIVPVLILWITPKWRNFKRGIKNQIEANKPIFSDPERNRLAILIRDGEVDALRKQLSAVSPDLFQDGELLGYAIGEATSSTYRPAEKLECLRLLFQAGATWKDTNAFAVPLHFYPADVGNAAVLRLLLEKGANPNAIHPSFERPILFEAIGGYQDPAGTVRVLLEYGADPNSKIMENEEAGPITPLFLAAERSRWGVCATLLEHGADPHFKSKDGRDLSFFLKDAAANTYEGGYSTPQDLQHLQSVLSKLQ